MSRRGRMRRKLVPLLPAFIFLAGCAAATQTGRPEPGGVGLRLPVAESFEFARRVHAPYPPAPAPFFEDDEYRYTGRWLTLFEMRYPLEATPATPPAQTP